MGWGPVRVACGERSVVGWVWIGGREGARVGWGVDVDVDVDVVVVVVVGVEVEVEVDIFWRGGGWGWWGWGWLVGGGMEVLVRYGEELWRL